MEGVALGVSLVTVGGLLNGTWNIPTKKSSPKAVVAISEGWSCERPPLMHRRTLPQHRRINGCQIQLSRIPSWLAEH